MVMEKNTTKKENLKKENWKGTYQMLTVIVLDYRTMGNPICKLPLVFLYLPH